MGVSARDAVAIGNFDGVHLGHRAVLAAARRRAQSTGGRLVALTFHPHPSRVLTPDRPVPLLTTHEERRHLLFAAGVDQVVTLTFDRTLADLPAEAFVTGLLVPRLSPAWVVVGENFTFGRGGKGRPADLARLGERLGFGVEVVPPVLAEGQPISSSRIRARVREADLEGARRLLGSPYAMVETVTTGSGRGRELGFPTANLVPSPDKCLPPEGVYAAVAWAGGRAYMAAADLGRRPTFEEEGEMRLEVHLLDFSGDLVGERLKVELWAYVRPDRRFPSAQELVSQMAQDVEVCRQLLSRLGAWPKEARGDSSLAPPEPGVLH